MGKKIRRKNGHRLVDLHTTHGVYQVNNQRYIKEDGSHSSFLEEINPVNTGRYSAALDSLICKWVNEISYEKLRELLVLVTGNAQLSRNGLEEYIIQRAVQISRDQCLESLHFPYDSVLIEEDIDVYSADKEEIILMMDDVSVKAQKPHKKVERAEEDVKRIGITIGLMSTKSGGYDTFTEGIDAKGVVVYPIEDVILDKLAEHHCQDEALPIIAITDGAKSIRLSLQKIVGLNLCIILDWYHLSHKVANLMSMIACNKEDKAIYIKDLTLFLWNGKVQESIDYLNALNKIKNKDVHLELRGYLQKHQAEIIDYERRQNAGKTIGSGRVEKANDIIVAKRQKKKGMAWSTVGAKALAIVNLFQLNNKQAA